ncbi:ABC transporter substrate-binding protein [Sulfurimonas sp. MAG313]|nr:ABC transporter substrate-binding protein [Sulfurimonas sp. MAG313]MDF1879877.1 ABC transporter substrate-binding protein [Sulfurimonas sp. MAG313]
MQYLIIFIILCSSVLAEENIVLQLKWEHQFQFAGYYAALEKGYYAEYGLDVQIKESTSKQMLSSRQEVLEGRAHYGVASSSILVDMSEDKPLLLLSAIFEHSPLVLVCSKKSEIRNPKDLKTKTIMLSKDEGNSLLLRRLLDIKDIDYKVVPFDYNAFINDEADAMSAYLGNEPYSLKKKEFEYTLLDPANYGMDAYSDFLFTSQDEYENHPKRVQNFIEASLRGWKYAMNHEEEIAKLIIKKYNPNKSLEALIFEASMLRRHSLRDLENLGSITLTKLSHMILVMREIGLIQNDIDISKHLYPGHLAQIKLSKKEKTWINKHANVSFSSNRWLPNGYADGAKEISHKYMDLIALKSGLNIKYMQKEPSEYALAELARGRIDLFIGTQKGRNTLMSESIRHYPLVLVTKNDVDYISHTQSLNMKTMALVKNSASSKYIEKYYPRIKKVYVNNIKEALDLVSSSTVFATVEVLPLVSLHIKKFHMSNLKISGDFLHPYSLNINVRKDYPELLSIINKAILAISTDEHTLVNNQWEGVDYTKEKDLSVYFSAIFASFVVILILAYSNWRLRVEIKKRISTEKEFQRMLDVVNQNVYMSITDVDGNITYVSDAFCRLTGYTKEQLLGVNHRILKSPTTKDSYYEKMWKRISHGNIWTGEIENRDKKGNVYWVDVSITPIYGADGAISSYMAIRKDITIRKQMETLAITDGLCNLYNRRYFNTVFEKEVNRLKREHGLLSFLMIDIDHFKLYNDKYGHLKGDDVLIAVSACLKEVCKRSTDQVFRLGGEEFGVILLGMDEHQTHIFSLKLIKAIENLNIRHEDNDPYSWVTASLGAIVCSFTVDTKLDSKDVYQMADEAMYTSKQTGRNRVFISQA